MASPVTPNVQRVGTLFDRARYDKGPIRRLSIFAPPSGKPAAMKTPPEVRFRPDLHLLLWKPEGILTEKSINEILAFISEEEKLSDANELRFIDTSALTAVDLNFKYVFHVGLYRRLSRKARPEIKSAFFIKDNAFAHYFKLHAILTDYSPLQVRLFHKRETAAKWLNVSTEALSVA